MCTHLLQDISRTGSIPTRPPHGGLQSPSALDWKLRGITSVAIQPDEKRTSAAVIVTLPPTGSR